MAAGPIPGSAAKPRTRSSDAGLEQRLPEPELRPARVDGEAPDGPEDQLGLRSRPSVREAGPASLDLDPAPALGHVDRQVEVERRVEDVPTGLEAHVPSTEGQQARGGQAPGDRGEGGDEQEERRHARRPRRSHWPIRQESDGQPCASPLGLPGDIGKDGVDEPVGQAVDTVGRPAAQDAIHVSLADHCATLPADARASASRTARMLRTA